MAVDILDAGPYGLMNMRTTIRIDPHLLAEAKKVAAASGTTLTAVIEDALRHSLTRRRAREERAKTVKIPTFRGRGLQPGVNLDDSAALLEMMDDRVRPSRRHR